MPIKFGSNLDGGDVEPVRAKEDKTVTQVIEHGVEIERKIFAGDLVPPDLVDAYNGVTPERTHRSPAPAQPQDAVEQDPKSGETAPRARRRS